MALWHYENKSDPKIPSRNVRFDCGPSWLWLEIGWGWTCWNISFHAPFFNLDFLTGVYAGRKFCVGTGKWVVTFILAHGWYLDITLGVPEWRITQWKAMSAMRKATPETAAKVLAALRKLCDED